VVVIGQCLCFYYLTTVMQQLNLLKQNKQDLPLILSFVLGAANREIVVIDTYHHFCKHVKIN